MIRYLVRFYVFHGRNAEKAAYAVWRACRSDAFGFRAAVPGVFFFTLSTRKGRKKMNINVFFAKKMCKKRFFTVFVPANRCLQVYGNILLPDAGGVGTALE